MTGSRLKSVLFCALVLGILPILAACSSSSATATTSSAATQVTGAATSAAPTINAAGSSAAGRCHQHRPDGELRRE